MKSQLNQQTLVRMNDKLRITIEELAKDEQCSVPEWVREATILRIESELGIDYPR